MLYFEYLALKYNIAIISLFNIVGILIFSVSALEAIVSHSKILLLIGFDSIYIKLRLFIAQAELYIGFNIEYFFGENCKIF